MLQSSTDLESTMKKIDNLRSDILACPRLSWIFVRRHVTRAAPPSRNDRRLQSRRLEVGRLDFGRFGRVSDVAGATAAGRSHMTSHFRKRSMRERMTLKSIVF